MTHKVVPKLSIQGRYGFYIGPESRVWVQPDVSPCKHNAKYSNTLITAVAGPPDGHLPDPADQDSAATAREAHVRFGESAQGIPEAPARVVSWRRARTS